MIPWHLTPPPPGGYDLWMREIALAYIENETCYGEGKSPQWQHDYVAQLRKEIKECTP